MAVRDTPPSIDDGYDGVPMSDLADGRIGGILSAEAARKLARETYEASTNWLNTGIRSKWTDNLRAFQNLHPQGSKYLSADYRYRSRFYRPKTRSMVRRDEAATAAAFFSNEDVVSVEPSDDDDPLQNANADLLKQLLQYRLTRPGQIPWFMTLIGARQDCDVMGIAVAKAYWRYEERRVGTIERPRMGPDGMSVLRKDGSPEMDEYDQIERVRDHPWVDLLSPENFRFEPGCDWRNPVRSSPYLIEIEPVYIQDARERMDARHGAEAEWLPVSDAAMRRAMDISDSTTRRAREADRAPGADNDVGKARDFDLVWTCVYTVRWGGEDWHFRTLAGGQELLSRPCPLKEVHLHGERPYVVGSVTLETHKVYPDSKVQLVRDLQQSSNEDWNMRFDSLKLNLMPRQFVRNGAGIDPSDLRTFMPGRVVLMNGKAGEPLQNEVTWDRPPPMDSAAYAEQDRINLDFDELTGAFTNSSVQASQINQQSATGMHLMSGEAGTVAEYELRVFAETFVEPLLWQIIKLEQAYETDPVVLALAGKKANLLQYGVSAITDELLNQEVMVRVNVGIGATNPQIRLRNFVAGAEVLGKIFGPAAAMGANFQEVSKEVFGFLGYKDGARFFQPDFDPRVAMLQQQLQKNKGGGNPDVEKAKTQTAMVSAKAKLQEVQMKAESDREVAQMEMQSQREDNAAETYRAELNAHREMVTAGMAHPGEVVAHPHPTMPHPQAPMGQQMAPHPQQMMPHPQPMPMQPDQQMIPHPGAPPVAQPHDHLMLAASEAMRREAMMHQMAGTVQEGMQGMMQTFAETMGVVARSMQQNNAMLMQGLERLTDTLDASAQHQDASMERLAQGVMQSNQAVVDALSRRKRVVRGADGRVEGVEAV